MNSGIKNAFKTTDQNIRNLCTIYIILHEIHACIKNFDANYLKDFIKISGEKNVVGFKPKDSIKDMDELLKQIPCATNISTADINKQSMNKIELNLKPVFNDGKMYETIHHYLIHMYKNANDPTEKLYFILAMISVCDMDNVKIINKLRSILEIFPNYNAVAASTNYLIFLHISKRH